MTEKVARVFISFTSQDLGDFATMLRDELEQIFDVEFMQDFGPEQMGAQVNSINHLRKSDFAIFLVSPYYGSLIAAGCQIDDCEANCLKQQGDEISYTHCEYEFARWAGKHRIIFYQEQAWDALDRLVTSNQFTIPFEENRIPFDQVRNFDPYFEELTDLQLKTILLNVERALAWRHEIDEVWCPIDNRSPEAIKESVKTIRGHLIHEIVKFHQRGMQFNEFFDRALLIEEIIEKMNNHAIFINGVGGIGKSALAQLIAIFAWLEDRKIIIIDSGNDLGNVGYDIFQRVLDSIKDNDIVYYRAANGDKITFNDLIDAFLKAKIIPESLVLDLRKDPNDLNGYVELSSDPLHADYREGDADPRFDILRTAMRDENIILLIDDFHTTEESVKAFIKETEKTIVISRNANDQNFMNPRLRTFKLDPLGRKFIEMLWNDVYHINEELTEQIIDSIMVVSEGHPVITKYIVQNYPQKEIQVMLQDRLFIGETLDRMINNTLSNDAKEILYLFSLINEMENDIAVEIFKDERFPFALDLSDNFNFREILTELLATSFLVEKQEYPGCFTFKYRFMKPLMQNTIENEIERDLVTAHYHLMHETIVKYYLRKMDEHGANIRDELEMFYHQVKAGQAGQAEEIFSMILAFKMKVRFDRAACNQFRVLLDQFIENKLIPEELLVDIYKIIGELLLKIEWFDDGRRWLLNAFELVDNVHEKIADEALRLESNQGEFLLAFEDFISDYLMVLSKADRDSLELLEAQGHAWIYIQESIRDIEDMANLNYLKHLFVMEIKYILFISVIVEEKNLLLKQAKYIMDTLENSVFRDGKTEYELLSSLYNHLNWIAIEANNFDLRRYYSKRCAQLYGEWSENYLYGSSSLPLINVKISHAWEWITYADGLKDDPSHFQEYRDTIKKGAKLFQQIAKESTDALLSIDLMFLSSRFLEEINDINAQEIIVRVFEVLLVKKKHVGYLAVNYLQKAAENINGGYSEHAGRVLNKVRKRFERKLRKMRKKGSTQNAAVFHHEFDSIPADLVATKLLKHGVSSKMNPGDSIQYMNKNYLDGIRHEYDVIVVIGGIKAKVVGPLTASLFHKFTDWPNYFMLLQEKENFGDVWIRRDVDGTVFILVGGNRIESTLDASKKFMAMDLTNLLED